MTTLVTPNQGGERCACPPPPCAVGATGATGSTGQRGETGRYGATGRVGAPGAAGTRQVCAERWLSGQVLSRVTFNQKPDGGVLGELCLDLATGNCFEWQTTLGGGGGPVWVQRPADSPALPYVFQVMAGVGGAAQYYWVAAGPLPVRTVQVAHQLTAGDWLWLSIESPTPTTSLWRWSGDAGDDGWWYARSAECVQATGATGSVGPPGEIGVQGDTGAPSTVVGATGSTGATGAIGYQGATGTDGPSGASGLVGQSGSIGTTGAGGDSGMVGATGGVGVAGPVGLDGVVGATGASGAAGATGASGGGGAQGSTGASGATGGTSVVVGASGATGPTGPQGATGATQVYSSFYVWSADLPETSTSSQTFVPMLSLTTGTLAAGTYEVLSQSENNNFGLGGDTELQLRVGATVVDTQTMPLASDWRLRLLQSELVLSGAVTLTVDYRTTTSGGTSGVRRAYLRLQRQA
jgi:hypothetical protein